MQCASVYTNLRWHGLRAWSAVARTQESLGYWGCHAAGRAFLSPGSASIDIVLDVSVVYLPVTQWRLHLRTTSSSGNSQTEISSRTCLDTLRSSTRCPSIKTMSSFLAVNSLCYGHTALSPVCLSVVYMGLSLLMLRLRNFCFQLVLQNSQKLSCLSEKNAKRPWVTKAGTLVYGTALNMMLIQNQHIRGVFKPQLGNKSRLDNSSLEYDRGLNALLAYDTGMTSLWHATVLMYHFHFENSDFKTSVRERAIVELSLIHIWRCRRRG